MSQLPTSRKEASNTDSPFYFTGDPCKNNHVAKRLTTNGTCVDCQRGAYKKSYTKNNEAHKQRMKQYYRDNAERMNEYNRQYAKDNPELIQEISKQTYRNNKDAFVRRAGNRVALQRTHTPSWHETEKESIMEIYEKARGLSTEGELNYQVDHIVPLKHELVCGLHCLSNLQILTETENKSKKNRFEV